jgi:hypothetical protein
MRDNGGSVTDMTTRTTRRTTPISVAEHEDFVNSSGSLHGHRGWLPNVGRLPSQHVAALDTATVAGDFYVVMSYNTPIAWYANGEWTIPDVKYSVTTSNHQGLVRMGIHQDVNGVYA